jgi:molybdate transport system substrate-binding protein
MGGVSMGCRKWRACAKVQPYQMEISMRHLLPQPLGILFLLAFVVGTADAAEIKVLSIPGVRPAVSELLPGFERRSDHKVDFIWEIYAGQKRAIESGDFDVAIFAKSQIAEMAQQGRIAPNTMVDLASTNIGVVVRKGAVKPDVGSEEAFKRTLLAAKSIAYTKESSTGVYVTRMLERIGIADAVKDKLRLQPGGGMTTPAVANGDVEIGIVLLSDIMATPGAELAGLLPPGLQNAVMQTGAISTTAKQAAAGTALLQALSASTAAPIYRSKGLEPAR